MNGSIIAMLVVALAVVPVHADSTTTDPAHEHVQRADVSYKLRRFEEALAFYAKAYELQPTSSLLFSMAQCHRELGRSSRAAFYYESYLRDAPQDAPDRALAVSLLRDVRSTVERDRVEHDAVSLLHNLAKRERAETQTRRSRDRLYHKWWFWSVVGGSLALGGTAYYFSGSAVVVPPSGSLGGLDRR